MGLWGSALALSRDPGVRVTPQALLGPGQGAVRPAVLTTLPLLGKMGPPRRGFGLPIYHPSRPAVEGDEDI